MNTTKDFIWSDRYLLGQSAMDHTHKEFVECVDALLKSSDAEISQALDVFIKHAEAHFAQENEWLTSPDFPGGGQCHIDEHEKVLNSAYDVRGLMLEGQYDVARAYAQALVDWFPGHADYMDSALAAWIVKRSHQGRPLVFRRREMV